MIDVFNTLRQLPEMGSAFAKATADKEKNGRLITSHRSTTYSCCLPALGGFSRSWSCKTCRRKDREMRVDEEKDCVKAN